MAEPQDMILTLLREMRRENSASFSAVDRRLEKRESSHLSFRHALGADPLLSKLVTGEFEERIEILENKIPELEGRK